jgi:hypothetical protein
MSTGHVSFDCQTFDERLSDYLEGTLAGDALTDTIAHLATCLRCSALVRDLESIANQAAALPTLAPSRDLWSGIEARIEAPVVPLVSASSRRPRGLVIPRAWLGAMAAGLVAATAGVTYMLTSARISASASTTIASAQPVGSRESGVGSRMTIDTTTPESRGAASAQPPATIPESRVPTPDKPITLASTSARERANPSATVTYDREIESLRRIVHDRGPDLDPRTLAILDNNLKVIDQAIAESRAAIARDPGSRFLRQQLNLTLDKKLELLRTAALMRRS